jgi:hypothetical protein
MEMTTIFNLEATSDNDLADSLHDAHKAAKLARYATEGLIEKSSHSAVDADDLNLIQECLYIAEAHVWNAQKLYERATQALATVHPPLGEPVTRGERGVDCPVCGAAILIHGGCREDVAACNRCKVRMHPECYWGRVAALDEFQEYRRQIAGGPEDYVPAVVCAQCRTKGEQASEGSARPGVVPLRPKGA